MFNLIFLVFNLFENKFVKENKEVCYDSNVIIVKIIIIIIIIFIRFICIVR